VLIVDDGVAIREVTRSVKAKDLRSGKQKREPRAFEKAPVIKPDLVLLDLLIPLMNRFEEVRTLKKVVPHVSLMMFAESEMAIVGHRAQSSGIAAVALKSERLSGFSKKAQESRSGSRMSGRINLQALPECRSNYIALILR
jgi:DNA-binding NarL/FixJ family response regulator